MIFAKSMSKSFYYYLALYFILWIILFEFILPVNNFLPKPSIVLLSIPALFSDYHLLTNFFYTISVLYPSLVVAYFVVWIFRGFILKTNNIFYNFIISLEWFSEYLPGIILGLFLIFWFPHSDYIEYLFAFVASFFSFVIKVQNDKKKVKTEFVDSLESLGAGNSFIYKKVSWKSVQPSLFNKIIKFHFYLWTLLLIFEFIMGGYGLGSIYRTALEYQDLSALFTVSIIVGVTIYSGNLLLKYFKNKFYFWSSL